MSENKNLIIAIALSSAILFGFHYYSDYMMNKGTETNAPEITNYMNETKTDEQLDDEVINREESLGKEKRLLFKNEKISGSICLKGAKLDDLSLLDYKETTEADSGNVLLFNPKGTNNPYYAEVYWVGVADSSGVEAEKLELPNDLTMWEYAGESAGSSVVLEPNKPLKLTYSNSTGVVFERTFSIDNKYLITISDKIINNSPKDLKVVYCKKITRSLPEKQKGSSIHEGGIGYFDDTLKEVTFEKIKKGNFEKATLCDGWVGFTDKYWLASFIVKDLKKSSVSFNNNGNIVDCKTVSGQIAIKQGANFEYKSVLFAGAKVLEDLDEYSTTYGIKKFDLAVDFGWFYFLTKPLFYLMKLCYSIFGSLSVVIIFLTILTKAISYPLAKTSYRSMAKMKEMQPKIEMLKKRYGEDKAKINEEMMKIYKTEKINPMSGCLPIVIQMPIFFCLYKVFTIGIEMRHAPFIGWIKDLSAPDPTTIFNLFGLINWTPPSFLQIGVLPLIMGATMFLQQRLTPQPSDPTQAKMMYIMPLVFLFMFASFPSGLVLYWTVNNILSIIQQIMMDDKSKKVLK